MTQTLPDMQRSVGFTATKFAETINQLDFELVIYASYFDHSAYQSAGYQQLNQHIQSTLLRQTLRSQLLNVGLFSDDSFVDLTHLNTINKYTVASRIVDSMATIMDEHVGEMLLEP